MLSLSDETHVQPHPVLSKSAALSAAQRAVGSVLGLVAVQRGRDRVGVRAIQNESAHTDGVTEGYGEDAGLRGRAHPKGFADWCGQEGRVNAL